MYDAAHPGVQLSDTGPKVGARPRVFPAETPACLQCARALSYCANAALGSMGRTMAVTKHASLSPPADTYARHSVLHVEPGIYQYHAWQNVNVGVWVGQATYEATLKLIDVGKEMRRRYPAGHSSIVFILDKLAAPTPEARELLARFFSDGTSLMCNAVVLEGEGFWASGLRAMISNTHRGAAGSVQLRVGTSIDEILSWFPEAHAKCTGIALKSAELRPVLHEIRREAEAGARRS